MTAKKPALTFVTLALQFQHLTCMVQIYRSTWFIFVAVITEAWWRTFLNHPVFIHRFSQTVYC